ncbi:hypothetical protein V6C27_14655 [Peptococcaceae bacterium 1198_IL3148]
MKIVSMIKKGLMLFLMMIFAFSSVAFAGTIDNQSDQEQAFIKEFKVNCDKMDIDKNTQEKLLKKLQKGEMLDCVNPEKIKAVSDKLKVSIESPKSEYTFEDGSKIVRTLTVADTNNVVTPMANTTVKKIRVEDATLITGGYYFADVVLNWDYPEDSYISSVYDGHINVVGGTYHNKSLYVKQAYQNSNPAEARMEWMYDTPYVTGDASLQLFLEDTSY